MGVDKGASAPLLVSSQLNDASPGAPHEVSRVTLADGDVPHWISIAPDHRRVVVTGYEGMRHRVVIARFDPGRVRAIR